MTSWSGLSVHEWLLLGPVFLVAGFQLYYLFHSLRVRIERSRRSPTLPPDSEACSILIPVLNSASTLRRSLASILDNDLGCVDKVVVVLERCSDDSAAVARSFVARFASRDTVLEVVDLPMDRRGKVAGILYGSDRIRTATVLLLDADIVLEPTAVAGLLSHHRRLAEPFSSCLIFPYQDRDEIVTIRDHIICNNRLYRQSVVQAVKNLFGVANFPGGVQMVELNAYRELLVDGFLEDLSATYRVLASGGRIAILPQVLAYEIERPTLTSLFLQRVRWTIGAIQHVPTQIRTAARRGNVHEKILVNSYHVMWELQHYVIAVGLLAAPFSPGLRLFLIAPTVLYGLKIARSVHLTRPYYTHSTTGSLLHCLVFPFVISTALVGSVLLLLKKRRFFFGSSALYRRS